MNYEGETRREFLKKVSLAALALPLVNSCTSGAMTVAEPKGVLDLIRKNARPRGAEAMGAIDVPDSVSWRTGFAIAKDDGEPIVISGTVYRQDGKTPAPNVLIYFYHTDKFGVYGRSGQHKHGRFRCWMLTDERGRYEFASIRPASYPNSTQSQHVHMTITGTDFREDWIDSILFEGDPLISARERGWSGKRGGFNPIVTLRPGKDGVLHAVRDIQLLS